MSAIVLVLELTHRVDALMAPMMLAVAGAVFVARLFELRSIYSGRIHAGREAAESGDQREAISAAARYPELVRALMRGGAKALKVIDEQGHAIGEISAARIASADGSSAMLETVTAGDFAVRETAPHQHKAGAASSTAASKAIERRK